MKYTYYRVNYSDNRPYFIIVANEGYWIKFVTNDNQWTFNRLIRSNYDINCILSSFEVAYLGLDLIPLIEGQSYFEK